MSFWSNVNRLFGRSQLLDIVIQNNANSAIYPPTNAKYYSETYTSNNDVFSVINKIVGPASRVPVFQVDKKTLKEKPGFASELLSKPNPFQSKDEFVYQALTTFKMFGECFIAAERPEFGLRAKKAVRLDSLPPQWIQLKIGSFFEPITGFELMLGANQVNYEFSDVMFWKMFNPDFQMGGDHLRGMSPLKPLLKAVFASSSGYDAMVAMFQNMGAYGILTILGVRQNDGSYSDKITTKEQLSEFEATFRRKMSGTKNFGKIATTTKSTEWTNFGLNSKEMEVIKSIVFAGSALYDAYDVPDILKSGSQSRTYMNFQEAQKALWNNAIIPTTDGFYQKLSDWLMPLVGEENTVFQPNYDDIPALQEDKKSTVEWMIRAGLTGNEIRVALGYDELPFENLNVPLVSAGMQRIDEIGLAPEPDVVEDAMKVLKLSDYRVNGKKVSELLLLDK